MTIETRVAFPEGGTECPPEENTVAAPTASSLSNNATNGNDDKLNEDKPQLKGLSRKRKKGRKPKRVLETPNPKSNESSKTDKTTDETSTVEDGGSSSTPLRSEKTDDLKKSKVKNQNDGSKTDNSTVGASRKSMRLLLRRGRVGNYSGFLWPKDRPRYVEDLKLPLDFEDEKTKIMFMDSIGLFPRCKEPKIETETLIDDKCSTNVQDDINVLNKDTHNINVLEEKHIANVLNEKLETEPSDPVDNKTSEFSLAACHESLSAVLPSSKCIAKALNSDIDEDNDDDDDGGWEIWVHRIPANLLYGQSTIQQSSPSQKEINDSLKRLTQLGTEVVLVTASGI